MMKMVRALSLTAILAVAAIAPAQFETGARLEQARKPWQEFKLDSKKTMTLSFRNANIDMVIDLFSRTSGITIIKDPALKDPITVTSPKAVSLNDAFEIFSTALSLRNFEISKEGKILVIRPRRERSQGSEMNLQAMQEMMRAGQSELKVYRLKFANASEVARIVNDVFQSRTNPLEQMFGGGAFPMQVGGNTMTFSAAPAQGMTFGGQQGGGRGGNNQRFNRGGFGGIQPAIRASSDDYSNSVIVNAPGNMHGDVQSLINEIDQPSEAPQQARVYRLMYASAEETAPLIQNVLTSSAPTGRGGSGNQNVPLSQRFQQAARFGNFSAAFGTVTADTRTNALIVTATEDNHRVITEVIKELDQDVPYANNTFVLPLRNARADQVADLLNQAFGNSRTGQNRNNTGQNNQNRNNQNQNRNNQGGFGGGGFGGAQFGGATGREVGTIPSANDLYLDLEDPTLDQGELLTQVFINQGNPFNRPSQQQGASRQQVRGPDGRILNAPNIQGQVSIIPDQNTNTLIVVGSPENAQLIQSILDQLDQIPEQVMIETMIVEATLDKSSKLGVEWSYVQEKAFNQTGVTGNANSDFGLQRGTTPREGFRYTVSGGNLTGFLNALQQDDKFQVLSTPRIFTSNNVEAEINISQRIPYVVSQREDVNGNLTFNYAFEDVGIILNVTPRITANGYVTLDVFQTANDLQGFTDFNAPIINQRQAQTTVSVQDGETVVLGGIIRSTVTAKTKKIPLLGDLPLLGHLFKSTEKQDVKTELLVFLTPRVVRNPAEAKALKDSQQKQISPALQKQLEGKQSQETKKTNDEK